VKSEGRSTVYLVRHRSQVVSRTVVFPSVPVFISRPQNIPSNVIAVSHKRTG